MNTIDVNKLIGALTEAKQAYEQNRKKYINNDELSTLYNGMAGGLNTAIDLVKLQAGMGSPLEDDIERYMVEDVFLEEEAI